MGMSEFRALIVDDSSVMRKLVIRALRQAGLNPLVVYEASSGADGIEVLKKRRVDFILSGVNMQPMDGLEFLRQLREQQLAADTPVVMIMVELSDQRVRAAMEAGARGYISKPFTAEQVRERVLSLMVAA